ncbi:hypothetical protein CD175_15290 [Pseudomonas laurylsulfatiphila]|uniref:Helicase SNF2 n=1 Tax=Pseudomonas laurylsulfatiphila TaxID=2011015 RepID=A0A2S6FJM4_9PSED|nr:protein DpdE [Pseudomonas laurylsulfatiphila]PPK37637.1 hypothetical protein CD175_15290 [Pseudomonas laurylsulfatiphila]
MTTKKSLGIGSFVRVVSEPYSAWGVGKLTSITDVVARVEYFDAPSGGPGAVVEVAVSLVKKERLSKQTRVYHRGVNGRWLIGRILDDDGEEALIQFPNRDTANIDVELLQVRWDRPLTDPLKFLAVEATETPFLADARSEFVRAVTAQHIAAAGVTAVLASSVELVDYQFDVVRRVLTDPVQRYLLADEVGLGKTIEAGIIIRQYFIDDASAQCVIVVPEPLLYQWRRELTRRFGLATELDITLHVIAHDDLESLDEVISKAGMLVIDEAHHLSRQSSPSQQALYDLLSYHAQRVSRLLLLSATPVLGNTEGFLRVLHLLDPVVFPLSDIEGFKRRIETRQMVAEVVSMLQPENVWTLVLELDRLIGAYGDDPFIVEKVASLRSVLETYPSEEDPAFLSALEDLKSHLIESYRLHRRLLRNRRAAVTWATPRRAKLHRVTYTSSRGSVWRERLESLRISLVNSGDTESAVAQIMLAAAVHPLGVTSLSEALRAAGVSDQDILQLAISTDHAAQRMHEGRERIERTSRLIGELLQCPGVQVVLFCDQIYHADQVASALRIIFGDSVVRHSPIAVDEYDDSSEADWESFLTAPDLVRVLVCDARAEEGVNLHGGRKVAVHFDLPSSPNRLEQRLGRLDRYGSGSPIPSYALIDDANGDELAWTEVLDLGWGVFQQSVASLQYLIESVSDSLALEWVNHGVSALTELTIHLSGPEGLVQREISQLNHQDAIDSLANREIPGMEALEDQDGDYAVWQSAFRQFAGHALGFVLRSETLLGQTKAEEAPFRIGYAYRDVDRETLLPLSGFMKNFLITVDPTAVGGGARLPLSYRYAFKRKTATNRKSLAHEVRLLRVGDPLVTALERVCESDDRGRAFAVWRADREYLVSDPCGADLYFRFDFVVRPAFDAGEAFAEEGDGSPSRNALLRKGGMFLPPLSIRIWMHGSGGLEIEPSELLAGEYIDRPQGGRSDFNLNASRWSKIPSSVRATWMRDWSGLCTGMRMKAEAAVRTSDAVTQHIAAGARACAQERKLCNSQGEVRAGRLNGAAREQELRELHMAVEMYRALEAAIERPRVDLDVVGAVFLSSSSPFEA